jgi:predicted DNA-binding protein with PD1-like motif
MRTRLLSDDVLRVYAVVFESDDEPMAGLAEFAEDAGLDAAHLTAIGAFEHATVGWFDLEKRDYRRIEVNEQVEVLSFSGDITHDTDGSKPKVHVHTVLGRSNGAAVGGHLLQARVRPTLEVVVTETPVALRRRADPATGLALIDLDGSPGP